MSKLQIDFREVTTREFTDLELPAPDTGERLTCWEYFSKGFDLADDIDLLEIVHFPATLLTLICLPAEELISSILIVIF